ncbi:MAG: hypothetical protein LBT48_02410 [Prevotellaceae bacterium]|jgi:hypothetical protein|nr:hypothetical protein [Prevotellaceae bacterium]
MFLESAKKDDCLFNSPASAYITPKKKQTTPAANAQLHFAPAPHNPQNKI